MAGDLVKHAEHLMKNDPGLPRPNPTRATWQDPPHPTISAIQSAQLPTKADIVIIGSGITGCCAAETLLNHPAASGLRIVLLEARSTCSGASGRNGGKLASEVHSQFEETLERLGPTRSEEIIRFSEANIARAVELVHTLEPEQRAAVELRPVVTTVGYEDSESAEKARRSIELLNATHSGLNLKFKFVSRYEARKEYLYRDAVMALEQHGGYALWPYRLVTGIFQNLLDKHKGRFSLETWTPVQAIDYVESTGEAQAFYSLSTPRGTITATKVIHCTNGFSGHLNPNLAGKIFPYRGTMSTQKPGPSFPRLGDKVSWAYIGRGSFDSVTHVWNSGLYYGQQNALTGDLWFGGEKTTLEDMLTGDDSNIGATAKANISTVLPALLDNAGPIQDRRIWSGIMGWSSDGMPLVGKLTVKMSGRGGSGEFIAAGFSGGGMNKCWLTGQAVARMALGEDAPSWFPKAYLMSDERVKDMTPTTVAKYLMSLTPVVSQQASSGPLFKSKV